MNTEWLENNEYSSEGSTSLFYLAYNKNYYCHLNFVGEKIVKQILSTRSGIQCQEQEHAEWKSPNIYTALLPYIKWSGLVGGTGWIRKDISMRYLGEYGWDKESELCQIKGKSKIRKNKQHGR